MEAEDYLKGFIVGGLIGAALGILYAPKSGKETRKEICHSAEELLEKAKEEYEETARKIERMVSCRKESLVEQKERLKKAVEAGVQTYKQEPSRT